ncbi:hypothetical protein BT96DRAFT_926389 [Gymnopus androsaceus JB14]|uniref:Ricin B lectin domain-containing protein n=1 Tax=Gymnopus androsaceus JB14 TaxID=1447944 RepID=A0A6A4GVC4_9AGAR|nr:hypothetical protein BT96DRAFT_926389 [Gymnopus androsaceus JB14]
MVNYIQNITSLAGAASELVRIVTFTGDLLNLNEAVGLNTNAIIGFPNSPGHTNQNWLLIPQSTNASQFTIQSAEFSSLYISYASAAAPGAPEAQSPVIASDSFATVFKMELVGSGPAVNLVDVASGFALTSWTIPDPTFTNPSTPLTMEGLNTPESEMQSFTIELD